MYKLFLGIAGFGAAVLLALPAMASHYVGSAQCFSCHQEQYNHWQATGHPYKLRTSAEAMTAKLPLPPGYNWDEVSYVIGGANKKARYIDLQGYIITAAKDGSEAKTQYNLENGSWSFYHKGEKKPYKCGPCHMTAYNANGNQDGRPGIVGTWVEDGIGCEECHGPGSEHIQQPATANIAVDRSVEACGKCHQRGGIAPEPPASGGFIQHHEQINELKAGAHGTLSCLSCHDPHKRAIQVKDNCSICHAETAISFAKTTHAKAGKKCLDCHYAKVSKSAISLNSYMGDVRTHIVKINTDPKAEMFYDVEKDGKKSTYAKGFITLDYACLGCHGSKDREWAAKNAKGFHSN